MVLPVTPSNPSVNSGYKQLQVTITSSGARQPLSSTTIPCSEYLIQLPTGGATIHIGGSDVTSSTGAELHPPADATTTPDGFQDYIDDLKKVYVIGTAGTIINVTYRTL
jgi:hypothetical protein